MENKILEFVREFNAGLENSNEQNYLIFQDSGFWQSITLGEIHLWDSENYNPDHFETQGLSSLTKQFYEILVVSNQFLMPKIHEFFAQQKTKMEEKFPKAKLKYKRGETILDYFITFSGEYEEEQLEEFGEIVKEDFEFEFEGLKINEIWYE